MKNSRLVSVWQMNCLDKAFRVWIWFSLIAYLNALVWIRMAWSECLGWRRCCLVPFPGCKRGWWVCNKSCIIVDDRESSWCMFSESPVAGSQKISMGSILLERGCGVHLNIYSGPE